MRDERIRTATVEMKGINREYFFSIIIITIILIISKIVIIIRRIIFFINIRACTVSNAFRKIPMLVVLAINA